MLDRLTGKVAVVTGASRGIGRAIALRLAQEGAAVVINYNGSKERAQEVKTEIESAGGTAQIMQCDVADAASCDEMFQTIIKEFGRIDILVNNAGITRDGLLMKMAEEDFTKEWEKANAFNDTIIHNNVFGDVFGENGDDIKNTEYWQILNVGNDGVMGYVSIPKINVKLSIYHGTADDVLQTGIGHLNGTKLPIGGESTHSVLAAHRGLPSARLFTDIDQLERGDMFYVHVLDETLAYQVDQILDMVDKDDSETLQKALQIEEGQDYVTLFTCTPYGVNSHRLLVRGTRVPYNGEEEIESTAAESMLKSIQNYYMIYLILGLSVTLLVILLMRFLIKPGKKKHKE